MNLVFGVSFFSIDTLKIEAYFKCIETTQKNTLILPIINTKVLCYQSYNSYLKHIHANIYLVIGCIKIKTPETLMLWECYARSMVSWDPGSQEIVDY